MLKIFFEKDWLQKEHDGFGSIAGGDFHVKRVGVSSKGMSFGSGILMLAQISFVKWKQFIYWQEIMRSGGFSAVVLLDTNEPWVERACKKNNSKNGSVW